MLSSSRPIRGFKPSLARIRLGIRTWPRSLAWLRVYSVRVWTSISTYKVSLARAPSSVLIGQGQVRLLRRLSCRVTSPPIMHSAASLVGLAISIGVVYSEAGRHPEDLQVATEQH